jgi:hypothetical protein
MNESNYGLRPCIVDKKQKGLFHCWEEESQPVAAAISIGGAPAGQLAYTLGIVELEDGSVIECFPYKIRFLDGTNSEATQEKTAKIVRSELPKRWAPESEIEEACRWITKTVKPNEWPCGSDGEKASDALCKKCWEKWKSRDIKNEKA